MKVETPLLYEEYQAEFGSKAFGVKTFHAKMKELGIGKNKSNGKEYFNIQHDELYQEFEKRQLFTYEETYKYGNQASIEKLDKKEENQSPTENEIKLQKENEELKYYYELLQKEMVEASDMLASLQERDDNVYRVIFEAEPIPQSIREAGVGGEGRAGAGEHLADGHRQDHGRAQPAQLGGGLQRGPAALLHGLPGRLVGGGGGDVARVVQVAALLVADGVDRGDHLDRQLLRLLDHAAVDVLVEVRQGLYAGEALLDLELLEEHKADVTEIDGEVSSAHGVPGE